MKILFLSDLLAYGGASKLIYDLLPRMKELGHDCELLILTNDHSKYIEDLIERGILVHVVPESIHGHCAKIIYIKRWIEKNHYDILHANLFPMTYYCSIVKKILGPKCPILVMTEHSTDNKRRHKKYLRILEKTIYKEFNHIISISEKTQEKLCEWLECIGDCRFSVVENGIDIEYFKNAEAIPREKLFLDFKEGDVLLLTVGSFTPQKNHLNLIKAMTFLPDNFKLLLVGEGPLFEDVKKSVLELGMEKRVTFLGFRRDVANIMHSADLLVIPSLWEGFGLIAAEGMACGLPIVASDVPGLSDIVGDVGVKFRPTNPNDIAHKIEFCVSKNKGNALNEKMLKKVSSYDINRTVYQYLKVYGDLL